MKQLIFVPGNPVVDLSALHVARHLNDVVLGHASRGEDLALLITAPFATVHFVA